ncbi:hypothetical protein [Paenibacillus sp. NPDC058071]|uniref:hypothetical protein n=1 Tax=Paenibacillus sp. NPDC058071 TaxID=3346326 RepID=UPI0036DBD055
MKLQAFSFTALRLLAIYFVVQALGTLPSAVHYSLYNNYSAAIIIWAYVPLVLIGVCAWLLWSKADVLAGKLTSANAADEAGRNEISESALYRVGLPIAAIFIIVTALPVFIGSVVQLLQINVSEYGFSSAIASSTWSSLIVSFLKVALAAVLLFRADTIGSWVSGLVNQVKTQNK